MASGTLARKRVRVRQYSEGLWESGFRPEGSGVARQAWRLQSVELQGEIMGRLCSERQ